MIYFIYCAQRQIVLTDRLDLDNIVLCKCNETLLTRWVTLVRFPLSNIQLFPFTHTPSSSRSYHCQSIKRYLVQGYFEDRGIMNEAIGICFVWWLRRDTAFFNTLYILRRNGKSHFSQKYLKGLSFDGRLVACAWRGLKEHDRQYIKNYYYY